MERSQHGKPYDIKLFFLGRCKNMEQKYGDGGWQPFTLEIGVVAFEGGEIWKLTSFSANIGFLSLFGFWG